MTFCRETSSLSRPIFLDCPRVSVILREMEKRGGTPSVRKCTVGLPYSLLFVYYVSERRWHLDSWPGNGSFAYDGASMKGNILVVEDEVDIQEIVSYNLEKAGFTVAAVESGEAALESIRKRIPDLVVLDLMLPGMDGLEVCRLLKQDAVTRDLPILMLTARAEEVDRVVGLELGADDYVVKPFSPRELTLRIQAILRRLTEGRDSAAAETEPKAMRFGPLTIDKAAHRVTVDDDVLALTSTEFSLLATLTERRGRVQSREELLNTVWGYDYAGYSRTVDTHIRRLREKMGGASEMVETVRGVGYRFTGER